MRLNRGFTLLEVLIALVIVSIGLLAMAGLKLFSARSNQVAFYRGVALIQAADMAERIRANMDAARTGAYSNLGAGIPFGTGCVVGVGVSAPSMCTFAQLAVEDHRQWARLNRDLLPAGNGTVVCEEGPVAAACETTSAVKWVYRITVSWTEKTAGLPVTSNYVLRTAL